MAKYSEVTVTNQYEAALLKYSGGWLVKCTTGCSTAWTLSMPQCDIDIVRGEYKIDDTSVYLQQFVDALEECKRVEATSRKNLGEWINKGVYEAGAW
jgi:hypothetical protein